MKRNTPHLAATVTALGSSVGFWITGFQMVSLLVTATVALLLAMVGSYNYDRYKANHDMVEAHKREVKARNADEEARILNGMKLMDEWAHMHM